MINDEILLDIDNEDNYLNKERKKINVGTKLSDFIIIKNLGQGNFSTVKLVTSKLTNKYYAMKEIKSKYCKTKRNLSMIEKEIKLLQSLNHPNVIKYYSSFRADDNYYIITEYLSNGSLESLLKKNRQNGKLIEERIIWSLLIQTLNGLLYLHETKKIIHRDIKPDNLLLDSKGKLKILDFGVSAIKSETVEELLKCHGTVAGPIQFMSAEMALGDKYDFKSDIYMLGLTFFFLMSNTMPERKIVLGPLYIPVINKNAKLPLSYSEHLRNFIESLLKKENERPSTKEAFYKAINYYISKYIKITSIISLMNCLYSIPEINNYILGESISKKLEEDKVNNTNKYIITKVFKEALSSINSLTLSKNLKISCIKLKNLLQPKKFEDKKEGDEIELESLFQNLIISLHEELNKAKGDINNYKKDIIEPTNKNEVIQSEVCKFTTYYRSRISDQFYYLSIIEEQCFYCQKPVKYTCCINNVIEVFPDRTAIYVCKKDITVLDMFRHYNKKRSYSNVNRICSFCKKGVDHVYKTEMFYTTPPIFILEIKNSNETDFNLKINENINIQEFVERKDVSKVKYYLVGAIFREKNMNGHMKYISITRTNDGWVFYNGESLKKCSFNILEKLKNLKMLFYSSNA
jgi:serine/threonine protein kinase